MNGTGNRRYFLAGFSALLAGTLLPAACARRSQQDGALTDDERKPGSGGAAENKIAENRAMPRELVHRMLDAKVDQYMQTSFNCAQSSFLALEEQLGLKADQVVRALTPAAGIAERGETCGAVLGPLMVFGLVYGRSRHQLSDWDKYRNSLKPSGRFCRMFEQKYGSTMCHDIHKVKFGRCYDLTDPAELASFQEADATTHCSEVVRSAVRMAADVILDHNSSGNL